MTTGQTGLETCRAGTMLAAFTILFTLGACEPEPGVSNGGSEVGSLIEVRLAREQPAPDWEAVEYEGETLYLDPVPVLSDADLVHVEPSVRSGQLVLQLEVRPEAAETMVTRTGNEIGNRLAIIVDGRVRSAPEIRSAVGSSILDMPIPASDGEAARLAELIRSRWTPDPAVSE